MFMLLAALLSSIEIVGMLLISMFSLVSVVLWAAATFIVGAGGVSLLLL